MTPINSNSKKTGSEFDDTADYYITLKKQLEENLVKLKKQDYSVRNPFRYKLSEGPIKEKIAESQEAKKQKLENDSFEQDILLKKQTLNRLFWFLILETVAIFIFAMWQGFNTWGFYLEEWSFRLLIAATIAQITTMLLMAVRHLFPQKR